MKYVKPEIKALGEAAAVLRDFTKHLPGALEAFERMGLQPSYDLDE